MHEMFVVGHGCRVHMCIIGLYKNAQSEPEDNLEKHIPIYIRSDLYTQTFEYIQKLTRAHTSYMI